LAILRRGSSESNDEATVQRKNKQIGKSNDVRRNPVFLREIVRTSHPAPTIAKEISAAAIEWGAKAE
jgi:hypothetical protein